MSFPFQHCFFPPKVARHWTMWIVDSFNGDKEKARLFMHGVALIELKSGLPKLPRDVWNLIICDVFNNYPIHYDPGRWTGDLVLWLENWMRKPKLQEVIPLFLSNGDVFSAYAQFISPLNPLIVAFMSVCKCWPNNTNRICVRSLMSDFFLGVHLVDGDASSIKRCRVIAASSNFAYDIVFDDKNRVKCQLPNGETTFFYYCPNVPFLPIVCLSGNIVVEMQITKPVTIRLVSGVCDDNLRQDLIGKDQILLNSFGKVQSLIRGGRIVYKNKSDYPV